MVKFRYIYLFLLSLVIFSSCVMSKKLNYLQDGNNIPSYNDSVFFDDYRLQIRAGKGVKAGVFNEKTGELYSNTPEK